MSTRATVAARIHSSDVASISAAGNAIAAPKLACTTAQVRSTPAVARSAEGRRAASSGRSGRSDRDVAAAQ